MHPHRNSRSGSLCLCVSYTCVCSEYGNPYPRFLIPDPGFIIPDSSSRIHNPGSRIPDSQCQIPDPGFMIPDPTSRIPDSGSREAHLQIIRMFSRGIISVIKGSFGSPGPGDRPKTDPSHLYMCVRVCLRYSPDSATWFLAYVHVRVYVCMYDGGKA